jgi:hypothetical protein
MTGRLTGELFLLWSLFVLWGAILVSLGWHLVRLVFVLIERNHPQRVAPWPLPRRVPSPPRYPQDN